MLDGGHYGGYYAVLRLMGELMWLMRYRVDVIRLTCERDRISRSDILIGVKVGRYLVLTAKTYTGALSLPLLEWRRATIGNK